MNCELRIANCGLIIICILCVFAVVSCKTTEQFVQPDQSQPPVKFEGVRLPGNTAIIKAVIDPKTGIADARLNPRIGRDIKQSLKLCWFNFTTWFKDIWWIIIFVCAFAELLSKISWLFFYLASKAWPWLSVLGKGIDWLLKVCPKWVLTILAGGLCSAYLKLVKDADKWYAVIIPAISVIIANLAWEYLENKLKLVTTTVGGTRNVVVNYIKKRTGKDDK